MITTCMHCENFVSTPARPFPPTSCSQACHGYLHGCSCPQCKNRDAEEKQRRAEEKKAGVSTLTSMDAELAFISILEESTPDRAGVKNGRA